MVPTSSPNDPVFWFHHRNIDRLFQSWLANAGVVYGTGAPRRKGNATFGYPAQIESVFGRSFCPAENKVAVKVSNKGAGLTLKIGNGSDADWIKFLKCAYFFDSAGSQIVNNKTYGKRVIIGFPADDPRAALVPDVEHTFIDPLVFKANITDGKSTVDGQPIVYEELTLSERSPETGLVYTDPSVYNRQLNFLLFQPAWFNKRANLSAATNCSVSNAFGTGPRGCAHFRALVVTDAGDKMDLEAWSPSHYWMPGYFNQVKGMELTVRFAGGYNLPAQSCFGGLVPGTSCKREKGVEPDSHPVVEAFNQPPGKATYIAPNSSDIAHMQLESSECLTAAQMVSRGFVKEGAMVEATAMAPAGAKFCFVEGRLLDNPLLTEEANRQRNEEQTFGINPAHPASVFATADLARRAAVLPQGLDVTDHVYAGARPGHNAEDLMAPFDQLGYRHSPADFFTTDSASYDELYGA